MDRQVVALVKEQHQKTVKILLENRENLLRYLHEKETITIEKLMRILET